MASAPLNLIALRFICRRRQSGSGSGDPNQNDQTNISIQQQNQSTFWADIQSELSGLAQSGESVAVNKLAGVAVVTAPPARQDDFKAFIDIVNRRISRQVRISARVVEVELNAQHQLGVDWALAATKIGGLNLSGFSTNTSFASVNGQTLIPATVSGTISAGKVSAAISALEEQGDVHAVSNPSVISLSNQTAFVKVGTEQTFFSLSNATTINQAGATTPYSTTQSSYTQNAITIGTVLYVTPEVNSDGTVTVDVLPAISQLIGVDTSPDGQQTAPRMDIKALSTIARLHPDESVMIGGLIYDETSQTVAKGAPTWGSHPAARPGLWHDRQREDPQRTGDLPHRRNRAMTAAPDNDPFWLGRALVETKAITEEQFASAKQFWRKNPRENFATVLEILGLVSPLPLAGLIARHHRLPAAVLGARTLDRAAARLVAPAVARQKCLLPFQQTDRQLHVAVADPAAYGPADAKRDFPDHDVRLHVAPRGDILGLIEEAWRPAATGTASAGELFESLVREAVAERATDLHLEPRDTSLDVRQRIDGLLVHKCFVDQELRDSIVQAAKIAGRMDIAERRLPQDGQGSVAVGARHFNLRFSCIPAVNGESIVVRIIDERAGLRSFDDMGFFPADIAHLRELLNLPNGLVYVTGPTGAGKTTLLYSMLNNLPPDEINQLKIVTLEEPVEVRNPRFFLQLAVDERIGRTFGELLRHCLRHDPDVILVGETRDRETAEITLRASLTGHLCFSTLHTNDALGAVTRLTEVGLDPLMLASALKGVIAQRLVRRPCPECRRPHPQNDLLFARFAPLLAAEGIASGEAGFLAAAAGGGCAACRGRGYQGRTAIVEIFPARRTGPVDCGEGPTRGFHALPAPARLPHSFRGRRAQGGLGADDDGGGLRGGGGAAPA